MSTERQRTNFSLMGRNLNKVTSYSASVGIYLSKEPIIHIDLYDDRYDEMKYVIIARLIDDGDRMINRRATDDMAHLNKPLDPALEY